MSAFALLSGRAQKAAGLRLNPVWSVLLAITCALFLGRTVLAETPAVGAKAADFTLLTPTGKSVTLSAEQGGRPLVLVILRGFQGYQCPYCVKQIHDFVDRASDFKAKNTRVLLVYPGPPPDLDQHAKEFLEKQAELPLMLIRNPEALSQFIAGVRRNCGAVEPSADQ